MSYVNYYPKTRKIKKDPPEKIFSRNSLKINYEFFYNNLIFFYRLNTKSNIIIKNLYFKNFKYKLSYLNLKIF